MISTAQKSECKSLKEQGGKKGGNSLKTLSEIRDKRKIIMLTKAMLYISLTLNKTLDTG